MGQGRLRGVLAGAVFGALGLAAPALARAQSVFQCGAGDQAPAINARLAAGGTLRIGPGQCLIGSSLRLPSGTTLTGAGMGRTIIKASPGNAFNMIEIGGGPGAARRAAATTNVAVSDLTLDGSADRGSTMPKGASGIMVWPAATNIRLEGLEITGNGNGGIYMMGHNATISGNLIHENWHNGIYVSGVFDSFAGPVTISGNTVRHNSLARAPGWGRTHPGEPAWDGIDCGPNHTGCDILNNTVIRNDIIVRDAWTRHSHGWSGPDRIIGNTISDSNQSCIDVAAHIDGFEVRDNHVSNCAPDAINVVGMAKNGIVSGNVVTGAGRSGIAIRGTGSNIKVVDNRVSGARRSAYYVHGTANVTLQGNAGGPVNAGQAGPGLSLQ